MKKIMMFLFCLMVCPAFSKTIDANTQLKWNAVAVEAAAKSVEFDMAYYGVYCKILEDLLKRDTFSVADAVNVCVDQLADYYPDSPEMGRFTQIEVECEEFGTALVRENNKQTDSLTVHGWRFSKLGKVFNENETFYALASKHVNDGKCYWNVFETSTDKKVAVCDTMKTVPGLDTTTISFKLVDQNLKKYDFSMECIDDACRLTSQGYANFYERYSVCANALSEVNFTQLGKLLSEAKGILYTTKMDRIYEARKFIRNNSATATTKNLYSDLYEDYVKYCEYLPETNGHLYLAEDVDSFSKSLQAVKSFFNNTKKYKDVQVKSLSAATQRINSDLKKVVGKDERLYAVKCSGECRKMPGTQDYVTCSLGELKATFEFDDICD